MVATILVADDETYIVECVATVLEDQGHAVLRAYDGMAALALLQRGGLDLLITDRMMPRLSGLELIACVREHPAAAGSVILMSVARPAVLPPGVAFLPKPFDLGRLVALVDRLIGPRPA
jgi:DNA-binding response OmpR family regulator